MPKKIQIELFEHTLSHPPGAEVKKYARRLEDFIFDEVHILYPSADLYIRVDVTHEAGRLETVKIDGETAPDLVRKISAARDFFKLYRM